MKTIAIIIAAGLYFATASAQKVTEKQISFAGKESLEMNIQIANDINIQTWKRNEVAIRASVNINDNKDNEAYDISFSETGNTVTINATFKKDYFKGRDNKCTKSEITWQVSVPEKIPFSVETINGNVTITGETGQMKVKSISGFIDLAVPAGKQADVDFSTITGTVFTNLNLVAETGTGSHSSGIKEKLNNGGPLIKLATISGDIFFRKAE